MLRRRWINSRKSHWRCAITSLIFVSTATRAFPSGPTLETIWWSIWRWSLTSVILVENSLGKRSTTHTTLATNIKIKIKLVLQSKRAHLRFKKYQRTPVILNTKPKGSRTANNSSLQNARLTLSLQRPHFVIKGKESSKTKSNRRPKKILKFVTRQSILMNLKCS
jgi:hypothetical protein